MNQNRMYVAALALSVTAIPHGRPDLLTQPKPTGNQPHGHSGSSRGSTSNLMSRKDKKRRRKLSKQAKRRNAR